MAEVVLGAVANGFAVASLAIQLVEAAQKLHSVWQAFDHANSDVECINEHLATLEIIAAAIVVTCQQAPHIPCGQAVINSLLNCRTRADSLSNLVGGLKLDDNANRPRRFRLAFKTTLKRGAIQDIEIQLRGDVMMLLLAVQPFFHRIQREDISSLTANVEQLSTLRMVKPEQDSQTNERNFKNTTNQRAFSKSIHRSGPSEMFRVKNNYLLLRLDTYIVLSTLISAFGLGFPPAFKNFLQRYVVDLTYTSSKHEIYLDSENSLLSNVKRRLKVILPGFGYQVQTSSIPRSITMYPIRPCNSSIFQLCYENNIRMVKMWFENSLSSPFVVNQHGENLLHAAARYAHPELWNLLLDLGVDGSAYDDRLLTPLDHLARKVYMGLALPARVVDTIRALVERGRCQPLLPVTSNAVAFYRGPEEGFAWLFTHEYAGVNLEERDSEDWTLLGDAAFNFGWWSQLGVDNPAICWQTVYLLRAGADPHSPSVKGRLTPLDAYLRGCTANQAQDASQWLEVIKQTGIDVQKYAKEEQDIHGSEHLLKQIWDEELWRRIPTKRRVVYKYGSDFDDVEIGTEDYDALNWFRSGRHDLEIFDLCSPSESFIRWKLINASYDYIELLEDEKSALAIEASPRTAFNTIPLRIWFQFLVTLLATNYVFHLYLSRKF